MKPALHWPIEIVHEKCQSSLLDLVFDCEMVTINRQGILTFHLTCCVCEESFIVVKNMLELTTLAALDDKEYLGGEVNALNPFVTNRPN
jgi:hypothetical protein